VNFKSLISKLTGAETAPKPVLDPDLREEIRRSFDEASKDEEHFPSTIDPRIQHVQVLVKHFGDLAGKSVLDVGCGKGRFARVLKEQFPAADIWGLDISEEMLRFVPAGINTSPGSMTELPFPAARFDCVYATESLEHAVEIEKAVAEMCRVLKPGGKLVIIDKNAEHWGRFKTPAWERWFQRAELEKLLRRDCREVRSDYLSYWEDVAPDGLFLAWYATK
jgi:ubiquinone/menaquinone biosynthesis C-methylase UbiE